MIKNILKGILCLCAIAVVAPDDSAYGQNSKGLTRSITINNGDTTVNGKNFRDLSKEDQAKFREEIQEMGKNFRRGSAHSRSNDVILREGRVKKLEERARDMRSDAGATARSYSFDMRKPGDFKVLRRNIDSLLLEKDLRIYSFEGDSSLNFRFNTDTLLKRFKFKLDGLDSNLRKRVITMHRNMLPGSPGGIPLNREGPAIRLERRPLTGPMERNNSSTFNYSHTDKDGILSRMSIRIGEANKEQLKKITGAETFAKPLEVSDLTLFPNFSSGKMTLSFNVASKGNTKISVLDSDMKPIFNDETASFNGIYIKQLTLPRNGVYYVTITQNGNWFVRRLVKE